MEAVTHVDKDWKWGTKGRGCEIDGPSFFLENRDSFPFSEEVLLA